MDWKIVVIFFLASFLHKGFAQDPRVKIKSTTPKTEKNEKGDLIQITAEADKDITMECYVENLPRGTTVNWKRITKDSEGRDDPIQLATDTLVQGGENHIKIEKPQDMTWKLKIVQATVADEGLYVCYVKAGDSINEVKDQRNVIIVELPVIDNSLTAKSYSVSEGDPFEIECTATGRPTPVISWSKSSGATLPGGGKSLLEPLFTIQNTEVKDKGNYICTAQNALGADRQKIELKVEYVPKISFESLGADGNIVRQAVGYRKVIRCIISAYPEVESESCSWTHNNEKIRSFGRRRTDFIQLGNERRMYELTIEYVLESDYGEYECTAGNGIGRTFRTIRLEKTDNPTQDGKTGQILAASSIHVSVVTIIMAVIITLLQLY